MIDVRDTKLRTAHGKQAETIRPRCRLIVPSGLLLLLTLTGCGKSYQLETAPVRGTITIDGKPLATGKVRFASERGRGATGDIQPDGTYTLTTYTTGDGATVGKHRVAIEAKAKLGKVAVEYEGPPPQSLIPEHYADESTSGLEFEVKAGATNQADFPLRSR